MVHDLRAMCDAVAYVVKNGVEWRALPVDFPPWEAVYAFWERWNNRGLPQELIRRLGELLRQHQGRTAEPSACIADSQIVKAHGTVPKTTSGYHGGRKITGRGRHLAVDAEGWLLALVVTAASARSMVQKAWARAARVTWRCQPANERPSKWLRPRPCSSIIARDLNLDAVARRDCQILARDPGLGQAETLVPGRRLRPALPRRLRSRASHGRAQRVRSGSRAVPAPSSSVRTVPGPACAL